MSEVETLKEWFEYIRYARQGYLDAFAKMPAAELKRDRGASYPSILEIYLHSAGALFFWIGVKISSPPDPGPAKEPSEPPTLPEVQEFERYVQAMVGRFIGGLNDAGLAREIAVEKDHGSDHDCRVSVRDLLWHLVEEEFQHLGEINALLWQLDVDPPIRDWVEWAHYKGRIHHPTAG